MHRAAVERSLSDTHMLLVRARQELAVLDEQLDVLSDAADETRLRSLVSETPGAAAEFVDAQRHADAAARARAAVARRITELEGRLDDLLERLVVTP